MNRKAFFRTTFFIVQFSIFNFQFSVAQEYLFPLNRGMQTRIESYLQSDTAHFHSALKPYTYAELRNASPVDSVFSPRSGDSKFYNTWVGRKIFKEHFVDVNKDDIHLSIDPVFNLQVGSDLVSQDQTFVNTRGVFIQADVKQKFFFYSGFHENQAQYVNYVSSFIINNRVAPGQGRVKYLVNNVYDFSMAYGGVAYTVNKHFDFLLAHDKNFIGDGYRSLLLSDNSYNYPFLRMNMTFWKFKYTVIYAVMQDSITSYDNSSGFRKKFLHASYLDLNIGKKDRLSIGIFEAVISKLDHGRTFEFNYINPVIFLRPVEYSLGSPDNELLGANLKFKINSRNIFYAQLMLDELLLGEVRSGKGWWANKQAGQAGLKSFNIFRIKNLNAQSEINVVRPYTYQHLSTQTNYGHFNQALAHPLGANFIESVSFLNYRWKNFFAEAKFLYSEVGVDRYGFNDGQNIFNNYSTHGSDYGHYLLDGIKTKIIYKDFRISYLVNPKTNFNIELGISDRTSSSAYWNYETTFVFFGLRTSLENYYFDF
jgi:hypothetical protein